MARGASSKLQRRPSGARIDRSHRQLNHLSVRLAGLGDAVGIGIHVLLPDELKSRRSQSISQAEFFYLCESTLWLGGVTVPVAVLTFKVIQDR